MDAGNPYAPPTAPVRDIDTSTTGEKAGRLQRLGATLIDGIIGGLLVYVPAMFFVDLGSALTPEGEVNYTTLITPGAVLAALPGALLLLGITWWLVARNGQTIGKKLLSIKVVRSDGSRASVARIFWVRNVPFWLVSFLPIVGVIISLADPLLIFRQSRKCLHDQLADTNVIRA